MTAMILVTGLLAAIFGVASMTAVLIGRSLYLEREMLRVAPLNIDRFVKQNEALGAQTRPRIVLFGDSRIEYWRPAPSHHEFDIVSRGIAGETTAQMQYRFEQDVIDLHPAAVIIQAGINDLVAASLLPGPDSVAAATFENLRHFASVAREKGSQVILMTIVRPAHPPVWRLPVWSNSVFQLVDEVNQRIRALGADSGVRILDADRILSNNGYYLPRRYAADTLHFTTTAYQALNEALKEALNSSGHLTRNPIHQPASRNFSVVLQHDR